MKIMKAIEFEKPCYAAWNKILREKNCLKKRNYVSETSKQENAWKFKKTLLTTYTDGKMLKKKRKSEEARALIHHAERKP